MNFFKKFGEILETQIIRDAQGNHRGCAFVKFASLTEADIAIASLNESCFLPGVLPAHQSSAKLQLKWADGEAKRIGLSGYDHKNANKLYVGNIPPETTEENLKELFSSFGDIQMLYFIKNPLNPDLNRCYLKYLTKEEALICIKEVNENVVLHESHKPLEVMLIEQKKSVRAMSIYAPKENEMGQTVASPHADLLRVLRRQRHALLLQPQDQRDPVGPADRRHRRAAAAVRPHGHDDAAVEQLGSGAGQPEPHVPVRLPARAAGRRAVGHPREQHPQRVE